MADARRLKDLLLKVLNSRQQVLRAALPRPSAAASQMGRRGARAWLLPCGRQ
jgi:hypothetical protein